MIDFHIFRVVELWRYLISEERLGGNGCVVQRSGV